MPFKWGCKQNFKKGESVIIYNLGGDQIEYTGVVRGKSFVHAMDSYIIELTEESKKRIYSNGGHLSRMLQFDPAHDEWDCIVMTEACLKRPGE